MAAARSWIGADAPADAALIHIQTAVIGHRAPTCSTIAQYVCHRIRTYNGDAAHCGERQHVSIVYALLNNSVSTHIVGGIGPEVICNRDGEDIIHAYAANDVADI